MKDSERTGSVSHIVHPHVQCLVCTTVPSWADIYVVSYLASWLFVLSLHPHNPFILHPMESNLMKIYGKLGELESEATSCLSFISREQVVLVSN